MDHSLRETLLRSGANLEGSSHMALHFGDAEAELCAALDCCAIVDRSDLGLVLCSGPDLLDLLNRMSTGAVKDLQPGQGRPTVVTTPKGRIVERLFVHQLGRRGVLLVGGPASARRVIEYLDRYTFAEQTGMTDATEEFCQLTVVGPQAVQVLEATGFDRPEPFCSVEIEFEGVSAHVLGENGLSGDGYSILVTKGMAGSMWQALNLACSKCGGRPAGSIAAEGWRILRGLPMSGHELTEDYNPLEAGLRDAVSFDKGCYVGQEVVAWLNSYDKVSRALVGLVLPAKAGLPVPGSPLFFEDQEVGRVTSAVVPPGWPHPVALAYVKRRFVEAGIEFSIGAPTADLGARLVDLPFPASR
jgi:folate-binding protein YgfZ